MTLGLLPPGWRPGDLRFYAIPDAYRLGRACLPTLSRIPCKGQSLKVILVRSTPSCTGVLESREDCKRFFVQYGLVRLWP